MIPLLALLGALAAGPVAQAADPPDPPGPAVAPAPAPPTAAPPGEAEVIEIIDAGEEGQEARLRAAEPGSVEVIEVPAVVGARTVADVLAGAVGVQIERLGGLGQFAQVSIRGSAADQVAVYLDGVPLQRASGGGVNLADLPLGQVERIEIWRGMAPSTLPGMPAGGAINLITRERSPVEASATVGSFETAGARALTRVGDGDRRLTAFAEALHSRGDFPFDDDNGTPYNLDDDGISRRQNNDLNEGGLHVRGDAPLGAGHLRADADVFAADRGLPGVASIQAEAARLKTLRALGSAAWDPAPLRDALVLHAHADGGAQLDAFADPEGELGLGRRDVVGRTRFLGGQLTASWLPRARLGVSGGVAPRVEAFEQVDHLAAGEASAPGPTHLRRSVDGSVSVDLSPLEGLWLTPAARGVAALDSAPGEDAASRLLTSPSLGLRYTPAPGLWLRASTWSGARMPSFYELFGDRGALVGNPSLRPEAVRGAEVGASWARRSEAGLASFVEIGGWAKQATDLIQLVQNSQSTSRAVNIAAASLMGVEARLALSLGGRGGVQGDGALLRAVDRGEDAYYAGNALPRRPSLEVGGEAWVALDPEARVRLRGEGRVTSQAWLDRANLVQIPPRHLVAAEVEARPGHGIVLTLRGENLLGEAMVDFSGYPLPGRSAFLTVGWSAAQRSPQHDLP